MNAPTPSIAGAPLGLVHDFPPEERGLTDRTICARCRSGMVHRRAGHLDVQVWCFVISRRVASDLAECSNFLAKRSLTLPEMEMIAVEIDPRQGVNDGAYR